MFVLIFHTCDNLLIGPFETYEKAAEFGEHTVFHKGGHDYEVRFVVSPRPDQLINPPRSLK